MEMKRDAARNTTLLAQQNLATQAALQPDFVLVVSCKVQMYSSI